jgi:hypothetical protein
MSNDRIWYCPSLDKRKWKQSTAPQDLEESIYYSPSGAPAFSVSLDHGKDFSFDEVFIFLNRNDAEKFYEAGFVEFEVCVDTQWMGFHRVAFSVDGETVAEKRPEGEHLALGIGAPSGSAQPRV